MSEEWIFTDRLVWHLGLHPQVQIRVGRFRAGKGKAADPAGQPRWLEEALTTARHRRTNTVGVAISISEVLDREQFAALLTERETVVVHLAHSNLVRSALARLRARQLFGERRPVTPSLRLAALEPLPFDGRQFTTELRHAEIAQEVLAAFVDALDLQVIRATDADVLSDESATAARVIEGAGLPPLDIEPDLVPYLEQRVVEGVDLPALRRHLDDTPYASMLEALVGGPQDPSR